MEFRCRLGTPAGEVTEGVYVAESESRLRRDLEEKGLLVLDLERRGTWGLPALPGLLSARRSRVTTREFLIFNQQLATLLKAGMPLVQSLDVLRQRVGNPVFKSVLDDVHDRVRAGASLSEGFEAQGDMFPGIYTASLVAGEKSGGLEQVIRRYVSYAHVIAEVRRKTLSALLYPAILLVLSILVVAIIIVRVVPEFAGFYAGFGAELPLATRAIVAASGLLREQFLLLTVLLVGGVLGLRTWLGDPSRVVQLHRLVMGAPFAGPIVRKFATAQMARTVSILLGGGMPVVQALEIVSRSMGNRYMAAELSGVAQQVREGESMAGALASRGAVFPDVAIKMVEVGESTGAMQDMLNSLAEFYDEEIETHLGRFITVIEPLLLVVMGLVIAALLLALYMPLFQLSSVV